MTRAKNRVISIVSLLLLALGPGCSSSTTLHWEGGASDGPVNDGIGDWGDVGCVSIPEPTISAGSGTAYGFATSKPGGSVTFTATVTCPAPCGSCTYEWNFGNNQKSTTQAPPAVTYATQGIYHVTLTVSGAGGKVKGSGKHTQVVWSGQMSDKFDRAQIGWDSYLWIKPMNPKALFSIDNGWLHVKHDIRLPGSTAILAASPLKDLHVEVTVRRSKITTVVHYCDVVLRLHPKNLNGAFYRVRVKESPASEQNELDMSVFKIIASDDEHGIDITGTPPVLANFDPTRTTDIRVTIDLKDVAGVPTMDITFADAASPTTVFLSLKGLKDTDTTAKPHTGAGFVGLTHFDGDTYFDDFKLDAK